MTIAPDSTVVGRPASRSRHQRRLGSRYLVRTACSLGNPVFEDVGRQLTTNVVDRDRSADPAPGSAITLPPVTAPADMLALNHGLMRLSFVVAPVLPRTVMQSPRPGTSKLHAGRVHVVGGICVIAGQRVLADPAMQIAVAQNVT